MDTSPTRPEPRAESVGFSEEDLVVSLSDGRKIVVPLDWFPRLRRATKGERENWQLLGGGTGIHWPDVDEDISVEGLLRGDPARDREPAS